MLTPWARRVVSRIRCLNRSRAFGAMMRLTSGPALKLNPRNFRSCGRHRALRFVYLELEFMCDETRNALHHSLTGTLAAHVDVAIIRVAGLAVATTLKLSVQFVEHEVGQQG